MAISKKANRRQSHMYMAKVVKHFRLDHVTHEEPMCVEQPKEIRNVDRTPSKPVHANTTRLMPKAGTPESPLKAFLRPNMNSRPMPMSIERKLVLAS